MKVIPIDRAAETVRNEPELSLVPQAPAAQRARDLMHEAQVVALTQLDALQIVLQRAQTLAEAVAEGGSELYGPGLPDLTRRLAEDLDVRGKTLQALTDRRRAATLH